MRRRVLVVDDDTNLCLALRYRFEREKYDVEVATNGWEALEKIRAEPPDVIILDLAMPHMNGLELLNRLRDDPHLLSVPVIILTAVGLDLYRGGRERPEVTDLIMKPFTTKRLVSAVRKALEDSNQGEAHLDRRLSSAG